MTIDGGKPHAVGDKGQRYEVTYFDPGSNTRKVMGWTDVREDAVAMGNTIDAHPSWGYPQVRDRSYDPDASGDIIYGDMGPSHKR